MIPTIDPRVKYVGASHLRKLNSSQLRQLDGVIVVRDNSEPLAVIVPYQTYLKLQQEPPRRPRCITCGVGLTSEDLRLGRCPYCKNSLSEPPARELLVELDGEGEEE